MKNQDSLLHIRITIIEALTQWRFGSKLINSVSLRVS